MKKFLTIVLCLLPVTKNLLSQNVGIGTNTPNANAALEIFSNSKGLLTPRLSQTEINNIIGPPQGLLVFNLTSNSFQYYNGVLWINITNSGIVTGLNNRIPKFTGNWGMTSGMMLDNGTGVSLKEPVSAADASAILDVQSTTKGMLLPRMTLAQRNAIVSPAAALMIYQTDNTPGFYYYDGAGWIQISSGAASNYWALNGTNIYNSNTGNTGIGTSTPAFKLDVQGRMRIKSGTPGNVLTSAGIWMDDYRDGATNRFFFGMKDSIRAGFYGSGPGGTGWDFTFNTQNGNIGIGYLDPAFYKLTIDGEVGLYRTTQAGTNLYGSFEYNTGSLQINARIGNIITNTSPENIIMQHTTGLGNSSGNVGIGTLNPDIKLQIEGGSGIGASSGGYLQIGSSSSTNIAFDPNQVQARNNGTASTLFLQTAGDLQIGGTNNIIINDGYQVYRNRPFSTNADLLPIAYGKISSAGSALSGTGNLSVTKQGTGLYRIVLLGESNMFANWSQYTILVTVNATITPRYVIADIQNDDAIWIRIASPTLSWTNVNMAVQCGCPSGTQASLLTSGVQNTASDENFSILVYKM